MPPSEIGSRLSAYEFNYLHLAETLEPYGEKRADYRAIFIAWMITCVNCKNPPNMKKISEVIDVDSINHLERDFSTLYSGHRKFKFLSYSRIVSHILIKE